MLEVDSSRDGARRRITRIAVTLGVVGVASLAVWAAWNAYMETPWTRDATVRAYVVAMAPEVAGRIVELPVADNQFVHKGDLLMVVDPTDYKIGVSLAEAAVEQARATAQNAEAEFQRRQKLDDLAASTEEKQTFAANALAAQAGYRRASANLDQANVSLRRTRILSPVNGYVTNLLARRLRQHRTEEYFRSQRRLLLGRWLFRGDEPVENSRERRCGDQVAGLSPSPPGSCEGHRERHQRRKRAI
jgi:multidrug resistance efflux pump